VVDAIAECIRHSAADLIKFSNSNACLVPTSSLANEIRSFGQHLASDAPHFVVQAKGQANYLVKKHGGAQDAGGLFSGRSAFGYCLSDKTKPETNAKLKQKVIELSKEGYARLQLVLHNESGCLDVGSPLHTLIENHRKWWLHNMQVFHKKIQTLSNV
jgi:hypothetical protein